MRGSIFKYGVMKDYTMYFQSNIERGNFFIRGFIYIGDKRKVVRSSSRFRMSDMEDISPGGFKTVDIFE